MKDVVLHTFAVISALLTLASLPLPRDVVTSDHGVTGETLGTSTTCDEPSSSSANPEGPASADAIQLRAEYAIRMVETYLEDNTDAVGQLDELELQTLVDSYAQFAWERTAEWTAMPDDAPLPLVLVKPKYECQQSQGCEATDACSYDGYKGLAYCVVTSCGKGACPTCPSLFDLDKLIVKGWCSYTCMLEGQIIGIKIRVLLQINKEISKCVKLEKPVPCEGTCRP